MASKVEQVTVIKWRVTQPNGIVNLYDDYDAAEIESGRQNAQDRLKHLETFAQALKDAEAYSEWEPDYLYDAHAAERWGKAWGLAVAAVSLGMVDVEFSYSIRVAIDKANEAIGPLLEEARRIADDYKMRIRDDLLRKGGSS